MTNPNDPAFPSDKRQAVREFGQEAYVTVSIGGITKREYFAAQMMAHLASGDYNTFEDQASDARRMADALIKELSK